MTDAFSKAVIADINTISTALDENKLIDKTRNAVLKGIKSFQTTPAEKAKLYANFEMQFSVNVISKILDSVLQGTLIEQQIETEKQRKASMIIEDALKSAQKLLVDQQKLSEVNTTAKISKESDLLVSNKALVDAQKATQEKQRLDVMAGINVKNEQALSARQSAMFEEARRHVLIESTKQNAQIQKAKEENATLNSLAIDDAFVVSDTHLTRVKDALDAITVAELTYTEELTVAVVQVNVGE